MINPQTEQYILAHYNDLHHFCEVGVYEYSYCRFEREINNGKRVTLVEPLPRCIEDIRRNIVNKPLVTLHECAVADANGETEIYDEGASAFIKEVRYKNPSWQNQYYDIPSRPIQPEHVHKVKTVTFDLIDDGTIDILFVDTEGSEYFVLKRLKSTPKIISVETHFQNYRNPFMDEIEQWMKERGYSEFGKTEADTHYILKP